MCFDVWLVGVCWCIDRLTDVGVLWGFAFGFGCFVCCYRLRVCILVCLAWLVVVLWYCCFLVWLLVSFTVICCLIGLRLVELLVVVVSSVDHLVGLVVAIGVLLWVI